MALATGARIGPYDVVDSLGAGGMGEVYRARDSRLGRDGNATRVSAEISANVTPEGARNLDIFKDGRFVMTDAVQADEGFPTSTEIKFVLDWFEELKRLAPPER